MNKKYTFALGGLLLMSVVVAFAQKSGVDADSIRASLEQAQKEQAQARQNVKQEEVDKIVASLQASLDSRFVASMEEDFKISLEELARDMAYIRSKNPKWNPKKIVLYSDCRTFVSRGVADAEEVVWRGTGITVVFPADSNRVDALRPGIIYRANGEKAIVNVTPSSKCYRKIDGSKETPSQVFWTAGLSL